MSFGQISGFIRLQEPANQLLKTGSLNLLCGLGNFGKFFLHVDNMRSNTQNE